MAAMGAARCGQRCRTAKALPLLLLAALAMAAANWAFVPPAAPAVRLQGAAGSRAAAEQPKKDGAPLSPLLPSALLPLLAATPAEAAGEGDIPGAFVAYGHYLALVVSTVCLTTERLTFKANMSAEEESKMQIVDAVYGVAGLLTVVTGYLRVTEYGKGWEFYQHEPIFWLKVTLVSITGAASFFVTAMIIKRAVARKENGGQLAPMSEKLAARMTSVINAQLLAVGAIPLSAALMARGVGYADWLPWQAGAAPAALALFGLGAKYIKEALEWTEDEQAVAA